MLAVPLLEGQTKVKTEVSELKDEVKKNFIKLETIKKNISIIAEVQTAHKEQGENSFKNTATLIEEKTNVIRCLNNLK
jgi:predicted aspartyl protease